MIARDGGRRHCTSAATSTTDVDPDKECYPAGPGRRRDPRARPGRRPRAPHRRRSRTPRLSRHLRMPERLVVIGGYARDVRGIVGVPAPFGAGARGHRVRAERLHLLFGMRAAYYVAGEIDDVDQSIARSPEAHRANGIDVRLRQEVVDIDLERAQALGYRSPPRHRARRSVRPARHRHRGDADPPDLPGVNARGCTAYRRSRTASNCTTISREHHRGSRGGRRLHRPRAGRGDEEARHDGDDVEAAPQPMSTLDPDMGTLVAEAIRSIGIELQTDTAVTGFETDEDGHVARSSPRTGPSRPTSSCSGSA